jgi:ketosteroid isomerase-like protein
MSIDLPECHVWTLREGLVVSAEFYIDSPAMLAALER